MLPAGWRLLKSILLRVEQDEDGCFVVSDDVFALHGDSESRSAAIRDYAQTLVEYHDLLAERSQGDEPTSALLGCLKRYLAKEGE